MSSYEIYEPIDMASRNRAAWISLITSVIVFGLKLLAYLWTHSAAVLSDALETTVNVIAAVVTLIVLKYVSEPADEEHPYGHGKIEYFSAAFEGGLIFFASLTILVQGFLALFSKNEVHQLESGMVLVALATGINFFVAVYLKKVGAKEKSEALLASSAHVMSDVVTTAGVILGLGLVLLTGWKWLDPLMAIGVALHLAWEGWKIVRRSFAGLIDETDVESLHKLSIAFKKSIKPGIINIHNLRAIRSGSFHHIDAHLVVPEFWEVEKVHQLSNEFEKEVVKQYPFDGEIAFHLDPCQKKYCEQCSIEVCHLRKTNFIKHSSFDATLLIKGPPY